MSLLRNPGFENGAGPWSRFYIAHAVEFTVCENPDVARSGRCYARVETAERRGSIAQDIEAKGPSITALAYVRARGPVRVEGDFTLWDLNAQRHVSVAYSVGPEWTLLVNVLDLPYDVLRPVRVEMYVHTEGEPLLIDSITAF